MTVQYKLDALELRTDKLGIGVDLDAERVTDTARNIHHLTNVVGHVERIKYLQRRLANQERGSNRWKKTKKTTSR